MINDKASTTYLAKNQFKLNSIIWLLIILPSVLIECFDSLQLIDFRYQRTLIINGEWWRLVTGHLDHLGWVHLGLNTLFLALVLMICKPLQRMTFTITVWFISVITISLCMLLFNPELIWYVGLSSSLYSLLIIGIMLDQKYSILVRIAAIVLVITKVWFEQGGQTPWVSQIISGPVAEVSHLYGVIIGFLVVAVIFCMNSLKSLSLIPNR